MAKRSSGAATTKKGKLAPRIEALARNLRWTWRAESQQMFRGLHPDLWRAKDENPIRVLRALEADRLASVEGDAGFARVVEDAERELERYLSAKTWFEKSVGRKGKDLRVAYFCMEYGIHQCLPLYAGGLGILAADHLRSASDLGVPMVGVGILWRCGYYRQEIGPDGTVRVRYPESDFGELPVRDTKKTVSVAIGKGKVKAKIWEAMVGRVPLLLLDTDIPGNEKKADRELTRHLYQAGNEIRVRQEVLLGIGGLLALDKMGYEPTVFHLNEGHAAFCAVERVRRLVKQRVDREEAVARVRGSSVFTTHTPVPEGNDRFDPKLVMKYLRETAEGAGFKRKEFLALGREDPSDDSETFCMTVLALKLAERCNGVAELHGDTARKMWMGVYGASDPADVPIGHVTNGVHPEMWIADEARPFYEKHFKPKWVGAGPGDDWWSGADTLTDEEVWGLRCRLRRVLIAELRRRVQDQMLMHGPGHWAEALPLYDVLDEDALTIGFARRFALYKRAPLAFTDPKRLERILNDADRPVQIVFAGKAHPSDDAGHDYVRKVYEFTQRAGFRGRVFLLENYDVRVGRLLTQGCDLWLNNPVRPMEASGTSGMKPVLNAGLNCSILDGWWPEGFNGKNGWAIGSGEELGDRKKQDKLDAEQLYATLENEVIPTFYGRDSSGVPREWCKMTREAMRSICAKFSSHRMLEEYVSDYYLPSRGG